jgi:hypothetical protein
MTSATAGRRVNGTEATHWPISALDPSMIRIAFDRQLPWKSQRRTTIFARHGEWATILRRLSLAELPDDACGVHEMS